jgi:excinuclease ABC subunit C
MNARLEIKLKTLPNLPGVYFHKDRNGEIIYIGKAAILKNRVRQYFKTSHYKDTKTQALVAEIIDTDWIETESEIDALFFESEMVKRYKPRYNILLRDDKSQLYIRIDMKSEWPHVSFTRNPADDKAEYFGPYYNGFALKKALRYLRKTFPYYIYPPRLGARPSLEAHIGLEPHNLTSQEYHRQLCQLISYIKGNRKQLIRQLENDMKTAARKQNFELATVLRNRLHNLRELQRRIMFGDREFLEISKDQALSDLTDLLSLDKIPARIEGFDISHASGTNVVASQVVFTNGVSSRSDYRKYKTKQERNDDFYNMYETISRRLSYKNIKAWGKPDLILIDGGKGQLEAALEACLDSGINGIAFIGLAKRYEQIVINSSHSNIMLNRQKLTELDGRADSTGHFILIDLPKTSHIVKLLQRIRDESHRFAISYHTFLKRKQQTTSNLESIPGIGPTTRRKLIRTFGSAQAVYQASLEDLTLTIGRHRAELIKKYLPTA